MNSGPRGPMFLVLRYHENLETDQKLIQETNL